MRGRSERIVLVILLVVIAISVTAALIYNRSGVELRVVSRGQFDRIDTEIAQRHPGTQLFRFDYTLPYPHIIIFRVEEYREGQQVKSERSATVDTLTAPAGENRLYLFMKEEKTGVTFSAEIQGKETPLGRNAFPLVVEYVMVMNTCMSEDMSVPIIAYASDTRRTGGTGGGITKEEIIRTYQRVVLVMAKVERVRK